MTAAAFSAAYSDFKLIKTRGVVSISFEIPLKDVDFALQVLGGMPDAAKERWFGIAALQLSAGVTVAPDLPVEAAGLCGETLDRPHSPRKPIAADKRLAQQAGICCTEPMFWRFLEDECHYGIANETDATDATRELCGVKSRAELIPGTAAGDSWTDLHGRFLAWKMVPA